MIFLVGRIFNPSCFEEDGLQIRPTEELQSAIQSAKSLSSFLDYLFSPFLLSLLPCSVSL
jgi:hypothetical protein